ncbi:MAG: sn-glycerol-3-phosphate ABC transporter ATP-binding protein UgpC [Alphaproteobacteria bacterium]|nr:sn-glycerol-3-phosphate ABC transporter ATP-binding protein UgpC [Alphaproteobacteria bacterium]
MAQVSITSLQKSYGSVDVLKDINLEVEDGSFVVLVGPSGCGKSTLLRSIAGLEAVNGGAISIGGKRVNDLAPAKREIAMVFQSYALYPHMDVEKNMGFGLRFAGTPKQEVAARVAEAARILQLEALLKRRPRELSGGQRQRVAIGRAIVRKPQVFLFDEPLSNLDAALRVNTRVEIAKLHKLLGATIIYVTHDQVEAMTLADKIVVMNQGRIEQAGKPLDLYYRPANTFVANFIGSPAMNMVEIEVTGKNKARTLAGGELGVPLPARAKAGDRLTLGARPEHLTLGAPGKGLTGQLDLVERLGEVGYAHLDMAGGGRFIVEVRGDVKAKRGDKVGVVPDPAKLHLFDANGKACAS